MKTFEDALASVFCLDPKKPRRFPIEIENSMDMVSEVLESPNGLAYLNALVEAMRGRVPKGFKKRDVMASLALTAFCAGIRVGQEMEKREL